jgi:hypothetical protein
VPKRVSGQVERPTTVLVSTQAGSDDDDDDELLLSLLEDELLPELSLDPPPEEPHG